MESAKELISIKVDRIQEILEFITNELLQQNHE
jgi:hypothetical protein